MVCPRSACHSVQAPYLEPMCRRAPLDGPYDSGIASKPPSSGHNQGVNVLWVDGSDQLISETIAERTWREPGSRNSDDDFSHF